MLPLAAGTEAKLGEGSSAYVRHCPERTLLYQIVEEDYPAFKAHLASQGADLPAYVAQELEAYLECGRLEHGFLRMRCDTCHAEHLVAFSCKKRGFCTRFARIVLILARFAGQLKRPKFIPDELVTGPLRRTATTVRG